ncbi:putative ribonuclease H-like domain-containing protein [Tanacetum coccineum]
MRIRQYICHTDHNLWDIIVNGDLEDEVAPSGEQSSPPVPKTAKQLSARRNQQRVKSILLLAIPDEYLLKFHNVPDVKSLWATIKSRFRDIDGIDIDDLYNNLRVYEEEMKKSSTSSSNTQNLAFLSSENTNSTNEVSIVNGDFGVSAAGGINQMDGDDLEELDLQWQVAMLNVRVKKFIQRTRRNMDFKEKQPISLNKNNAQTTESSSQALVAQDGLGGYDWSNDFEVEPVNYALMAISSLNSSSSSNSEVRKCSKQCIESFKCLQKNYDTEREKHNKAKLEIRGYEIALESLESRILRHEKNESSDEDSTPANDMSSQAEGYKAVPPHITGNFLTLRADISFAGLDEYAIRTKIIESQISELNTKTSKTADQTNDEKPKSPSESVVSNPKINRNTVIIEDWHSDDEEEESEVQIVRPETQTVKTRDDKSGQNSRKQGIGSRKVKACFVCKSTNYLIKDCNFHDKRSQESKLKNGLIVDKGWANQPSVSTARPICTARPSISTARHVYASRPIYLRMDNIRPRGIRTVVHTGKGKLNTDLKRSKWVSRPKGEYLDHVSKDSGSFMLKKGNLEIVLQDHAVVDSGCSSHMTGNKAYLSDYKDYNGGFVAFGSDRKGAPRKDDVYILDLKNIVPSGGLTCLYANATTDESKLWHRRLGHVNFNNMNKLLKGNLVRGLPSKVFVNDHTCDACKKGKQHKASCKAKLERTIRKPLELLHMDVFGPVSVHSINKKRYYLVVTDDFSRFSWVFFYRCDHGIEFKNYYMNELCAKKGIKREFSVARTSQQNGVAERKNKTLIKATRTMLADSLLPIPFWAEAVNTACYGVQQGDPLGPLLFALVLHPLVCKIRDSFNLSLQAWYLDNGIIIRDTLIARKVMKDGPCRGLHLNVDKTEVFWPKKDPRSRFAGVFPPNIVRPLHGVKLLGGPATVDFDFSIELVMKRVAKSIELMDVVGKINDRQCKLLLLRPYAGISKLYFDMRTLEILHLPFAFGGLDVYSASDVLNYAFLVSKLQSAGLLSKLLRHSDIIILDLLLIMP